MALPVDVRDLMKTGARFTEERAQPLGITVFVEVDAPDALIDAVRVALRPSTAAASLQVEVAELGAPPLVAPGTDVVIAVVGTCNVGLRESLAGPRRLRLPVVVLAVGDEVRAGVLADALGQPTGDLLVRPEPEQVVARLGAWLADNLGSKRLALAHNFAFMRRAVAEDAVRTTAWQNGLIGAVTPIPGADMPLMTANQIKMLLQIAAAYGQPLGVDRIKELAAVVAGGYVFRALARQALVALPVLGWAIKGGIGYTGTMVMGRSAVRYFEEGADLSQVTAYFRGVRDRALDRAAQVRRPSLPKAGQRALPEPPQVALEPAGAGATVMADEVPGGNQTILALDTGDAAGD